MRRLTFAALALFAPAVVAAEIAALVYHDLTPMRTSDPYAVTVQDFEAQMAYLVRQGYRPVSLRALTDAQAGKAALPSRPVLLTFDDGLQSYYEHAYPILRRYGFPSVVSVVTSWVDGRAKAEDAAPTMTWEQLREISRSPFVEIVSHTDDLHGTLPANRFGGRLPAGIARVYNAGKGVYESESARTRRVGRDLSRSVERLRSELNLNPVAIAWPYGEYDRSLLDEAAALGMRFSLTLDESPTRVSDLPIINRQIFRHYRGLGDFDDMLTRRRHRKTQLRIVEVDLRSVAAKDEVSSARRLSSLLNRLDLLRVDGVLIGGFSRRDLDFLSHVTGEIRRRTSLRAIYLRLPTEAHVSRDVALRVWFNGVVLDGSMGASRLEAAIALLRHHKPSVRVAVRGRVAASADFEFFELDPNAPDLSQQVAAIGERAPRALVLLKRTHETTDVALASAMRRLRAAGIAHYGYGPDDFAENVPELLGIVRPLTEHTIRGGG